MHLVEANETIDTVGNALGVVRENLESFITLFILYRNIKSGANTMTRAGLTSPGSGLLYNWPGIGPDGPEVIGGNPQGTTPDLSATANQKDIPQWALDLALSF